MLLDLGQVQVITKIKLNEKTYKLFFTHVCTGGANARPVEFISGVYQDLDD